MSNEPIFQEIVEVALPFVQAIAEVSVITRKTAFEDGENVTTGGNSYLLGICMKLALGKPLTSEERQAAFVLYELQDIKNPSPIQSITRRLFEQNYRQQ